MATKSKLLILFVAWGFLLFSALALIRSLNYENFIELYIIGFLVIVELFDRYIDELKLRGWINVSIIIGVVIFIVILIQSVIGPIRMPLR